MNAHQRAEPLLPPSINGARAHYFKSGGKTLFGWLHRPQLGTAANLGLVICNPFGYEATCSHRSIRAFAEAARDLGVPALRFDYQGTGDSADIELQADQLDLWAGDVLAAIEDLQRLTGVERVCLMGIRLGALLAAMACKRSAAVCSVILIAPVVSGQRYVRELRTTRMAAAGLNAVPAVPAAPAAPAGLAPAESMPPAAESTWMDVNGFPISAATLAALAQIDLLSDPAPPAPKTLIIDGESFPAGRGWAESLAGQGGHIRYLTLPGLIEMIMLSPLRAAVPQAMVSAMRDWLRNLIIDLPESASTAWRLAPDAAPSIPVLALSENSPVARTEQPAYIASDATLFGIVTDPGRGERRHRGVILLNTGADFHIGANRMHVSLARRWARHGYTVLRLDLSGLGDSDTRFGSRNDDVFPPTALEEIRIAIDYLRDHFGIDDVTLGGVCSGAYHALRAAAARLPVNQILMINPQNYFWDKGMRIGELQLAEVVRNPAVYLHRLFTRRAWKQLLSGEVSVMKIVLVYAHRSLLAVESTLREIARRLRIRLPRDLGSELEEIASRGIRIVFVFARGEPGIGLLKLQGGSSVRRLAERCRFHVISEGDHIFSQRDHRAVMEDVLTNELLARAGFREVGELEPLSGQT